LGGSPDAPKTEFYEQSALVEFLWESRAQGIKDLKDSPDRTLGERIEKSAFIGVHQRPILCAVPSHSLSEQLLAADERR
jgi:hypothetical protein